MQRLRISPSQLATYRQCPLKWKLRYVDGWRGPQLADDTPAGIGTLWSRLMEAHYLRKDLGEAVGPTSGELNDLLNWMYSGYVEYWGQDPQWEVAEVEQDHLVSMGDFDLLIKPDLVVRERSSGLLMVVDHKTMDGGLSQRMLDLDDQFGIYVGGLRAAGLNVRAAVFNGAVRKRFKTMSKPLSQRFFRNVTYRTPRELEAIESDMLATVRAMTRTADGEPVYSAPDHRSCGWKCEFVEAHIIQRKAGSATMVNYLEDSGFTREEVRA